MSLLTPYQYQNINFEILYNNLLISILLFCIQYKLNLFNNQNIYLIKNKIQSES